jgi:hypothetical protein
MTEPSRAQQARGYLEMLGIGRRARRRQPVDVEIGEARIEPEPDIEIGEAQMEAPPFDERALEALASAAPGRARPDDSTTRRAEIALGAGRDFPAEWVRGGVQGETQEQANEREARARAETARVAARERSLADPGQRTRNVVASLPPAAGEALGRAARDPIAGPLVRAATYLPGRLLDDDTSDAILHGTTQGLTFGHADEIVGATSPYDETYEQARDRVRAGQDEAQRDAPMTYGLAELAGSLPYAAVMPTAAPGASLTQRALMSGSGGMLYGTASGAGHSRAPVRSEQFGEDVRESALFGGLTGVGAELGMEGGRRLVRRFGPAPEGAPRPGGDFTPEQRAGIDADPELGRMSRRRDSLEYDAAVRRVQTAHPNMSTAEIEAIEGRPAFGDQPAIPPTYPGGIRGLARDMDEANISPRRTARSTDDVQARAADVARPAPVRAGQFPDDEHVRMAAPSGRQVTPSRWTDDIEDGYGRGETLLDDEALAARNADIRAMGDRERAARARGEQRSAAMTDAERAAADEVTPARGQRIRQERPIEFAEGMRAGETRGRPETFVDDVEPVIATRQATPARAPSALDEEPIDFGMMPAARAGERQLDDAGAARVQANIRAAERRARRGGYSESTHDERTMPVRMSDVEDITPRPPAPAQPPPLPRRPRPQMDLGRWDAPDAATLPAGQPRSATARERVSEMVGELSRRDRDARLTSAGGDQRSYTRQFGDFVADTFLRGRTQGARAWGSEMRSDAMANEIVRRLNATPATTPYARALEAAAQRGPRAFGVALASIGNSVPEVTEALAPIVERMDASTAANAAARQGPVSLDYDVPYAGEEAPVEDDEEIDYGVPYADETDEQYRLRTQSRRP